MNRPFNCVHFTWFMRLTEDDLWSKNVVGVITKKLDFCQRNIIYISTLLNTNEISQLQF
jgi:hypothetical protein